MIPQHVATKSSERVRARTYLGERLDQRSNALNFIRLILASLVIIDHSWPLGGFGNGVAKGLGDIAVDGFFAISGYLIAGSRMRLSFGRFLWNRILRIFPAFWICTIVVAFGFAPVAAWLENGSFDIPSAAGFVIKNFGLHIHQWGVSGTLQSVPYVGVWDGSTWTLWYEFRAYVAACILLTFPAIRRNAAPVIVVLTILILIANLLVGSSLYSVPGYRLSALRLAAFFLVGMSMWALRDRISVRSWAIAAGAVAVAAAWLLPSQYRYAVISVPLSYAVLAAGAQLRIRIGVKNDISYGVYIYAFPVAQLLVLLGANRLGLIPFALLTAGLTLPLAWISWLYVERPAMALRHFTVHLGRILHKIREWCYLLIRHNHNSVDIPTEVKGGH